jgi:hypothetical protein
VQGRLRGEHVSASIRSECAECRAELGFTVDSDLRWRIEIGPRSPLLFEPSIDWASFRAVTIVNDY